MFIGDRNPIFPQVVDHSRSKMHYTCLITTHNSINIDMQTQYNLCLGCQNYRSTDKLILPCQSIFFQLSANVFLLVGVISWLVKPALYIKMITLFHQVPQWRGDQIRGPVQVPLRRRGNIRTDHRERNPRRRGHLQSQSHQQSRKKDLLCQPLHL